MELRELLADHLFENVCKAGTFEGVEWSELTSILFSLVEAHEWLDEVDAILALVKEAGYVKLADDQTFPEIPRKDIVHIIMERDRILLEAGWRKVELEGVDNGNILRRSDSET
mgnify:CR=1 FL=1